MKIAITGASGLVGSVLKDELLNENHKIYPLIRRKHDMSPDNIYWNLESGEIESAKLEGLNAVIHLAGESVASGRWTEDKKTRILESRIKGTRLLSQTLSKLEHPPEVLISASAIGFYGHCGDDLLDESSASGAGFLARVCEAWEQETRVAEAANIRVVNLRIGLVLSPAGGALKQMLMPFKLGLGGPLGSGHQYMSWIDLDDLIRLIRYCMDNTSIQGPVNAVAPHPVTNNEFTRTLGSLLKRPTFFRAPSFALQIAMGNQMANEMLLSSTRVQPQKILEAGFTFDYPYLKDSLKHLLL